jgi:site-specific recombinase XerD
MVAAIPSTPKGLRDRALLLIGFAGGFRRSELVALDFADIADVEDGLKITIRRSKSDQGRPGPHAGHSLRF